MAISEIAIWAATCREVLSDVAKYEADAGDFEMIIAEYDKEFMDSIGIEWP